LRIRIGGCVSWIALLLPGPFAAPVRLVAMAFSSEVVAGSR
jgi:hypothetical protein